MRLVAGSRIQPINLDLIPSWKNVDERLQNAPWYVVDGVHYGVPYMWMEHSLSSNLQSDLSVWFGGNPVVPAACTDGSGMQTAEGCATNGFNDFDRVRFWNTPRSQCDSQGTCVPYYRWVSDYIAVLGGR